MFFDVLRISFYGIRKDKEMILKSAKDALELKFSLLMLAAMLRTVTDSRTYKAQSQICRDF